MKNVRAPRFVEGLYRDMRDRRLLLPALALVIGLLAVPILLKSHAATGAPSATPHSSSDGASSAAVPAVVTQQLGVTEYRKRLDQLQSKNPFHQQYTTPPKSAQLHVTSRTGSAPATSSTSSPTSTSTGGGGSTSSSTSSIPPASGGTSSPSSPSISSPSPPATSSPPVQVRHTKPTFHLYTYRVSAKVGEPGKLQDRPEVKRLSMLPTKNRPIATFIGASEGGREALFLVSTDVDSVKGDGRCVPKPSACQYVVMKAGDKTSFHYAPNGKRYNLVVVDIHAVEVSGKPPKRVSGKADPQAKMPKLGPG